MRSFCDAIGDVLEVLVHRADVLVDLHRLVELALAFEVERQAVENVLHGIVHRALAEFLERHVQHALALEGEAEHLVGFRRLAFQHFRALLGDQVALRDHHRVAGHQHDRRIRHLQPVAVGGEQVNAAADGERQQHDGDDRAVTGLHVRDGERNKEREHDQQRQLGLARPFRTNQVLAVDDVLNHIGVDRHARELRADGRGVEVAAAGGDHADEDDFAVEHLGRDLLVAHVGKLDPGQVVQLGVIHQHAPLRIHRNVGAAQHQFLAGRVAVIIRREVVIRAQALQRERRKQLAIEVHHQRHCTLHAVGRGGQVRLPDGRRHLGEALVGRREIQCLRHRTIRLYVGNEILRHLFRYGLVQFADRLPEDEIHGQHGVLRQRERIIEAGVVVEALLRRVQDSDKFLGCAGLGRRGRPRRRPRQILSREFLARLDHHSSTSARPANLGRVLVLDFSDFHQAGVQLGVGEKDVEADDLRLRIGKLVHHLGHVGARPRPASNLPDAVVVNPDQDHVVGGLGAGPEPGTDVVQLALQALGPLHPENQQHHQADHRTQRNIRPVKLWLGHSFALRSQFLFIEARRPGAGPPAHTCINVGPVQLLGTIQTPEVRGGEFADCTYGFRGNARILWRFHRILLE